MKFASALPFTDQERTHCLDLKAEAQSRARQREHTRRKACPSGQRYDLPPNPQQRAVDLRKVGERD